MLIELKGNSYYSKVFERVNYKLANSTFWVVIMYKKVQESVVVFLILYADDILLIGNDVRLLSSVKIWLSTQFQMKD